MSASSAMGMHSHSLADPVGKGTVSQALDILRPFLPTSLPLYRRLQIGRFFQDTVLITNLPSLDEHPSNNEQPWYLAFLDRAARPETEFWIFASWEADIDPSTPSQEASENELMKTLLQHIKSLPLPKSHHQDSLDAEASKIAKESSKDSSGLTHKDYVAHLSNPSIILLGAIHERTSQIIHRLGLHDWAAPNDTYIFSSLPESLPESKPLPEGLHWSQLQYSDLALVRSRTQIPRQAKTLAILPHFTIRNAEDVPVAWAFVGLDGSLTTLHVEPEYRGKGLAKAITAKLFQEKMDWLWEDGVDKMSHGYVIEGNDASSAVCSSLGGKNGWKAYWIRVNLERV